MGFCPWLPVLLSLAALDPKPNVLMMVVDDLRPLFGKAYDQPEVITPNFDRFLAEGLVFRNS